MKKIPDAIFIVDPKKERICVQEAHALGITLIGICDTNCDPEELDYVCLLYTSYHADTPAAVVLHGSKNLTTSQGTEKVLSDGQFTFNVYQDQACTAASLVTSAKNRADGTIEFQDVYKRQGMSWAPLWRLPISMR